MSSAGHVLDSMRRNAQNREAAKARRMHTASLRQMYVGEIHRKQFDLPQVSLQSAQAVKHHIEQSIRAERRKAIIATSLVALIVCCVFVGLWVWLVG